MSRVDHFNNFVQLMQISAGDVKSFDQLCGDASTRLYFRAYTNHSLIYCYDQNVETIEKFVFWQQVYLQNQIAVPKIEKVDFSRSCLVQEDLGSKSFLQVVSQQNEEDRLVSYKEAIDQLVKIHEMKIEEFPVHIKKSSFDRAKFDFEFNVTATNFLKSQLKMKDDVVKLVELEFSEILLKLSLEEKVICHRDFHSKNMMFKENNKLVVIDFQDSMYGVHQYDLVSLVEDCYFNLGANSRQILVDYYWQKMKRSYIRSTGKDDEWFYHIYELAAIQRIFKAIGSFCYQKFNRNNEKYMKYVGYSFENLRLIMERRPECKKLVKILSDHYYDN